MLERICPQCGQGNPVEVNVCTACGEAIEQPLAISATSQGALSRRWAALSPRWQQTAKAVAIGATALALEVGTSLLRQQSARPTDTPGTTALARTRSQDPVVVRRRVWRTYRNGQLERETLEETQWFEP